MTRDKLHRRLESYWRLELASAVLIPGTSLLYCAVAGRTVGIFGILSLLVMCALLLLGANYWRAKALQLAGDRVPLQTMLPYAQRLRMPLLFAVGTLYVLALSDLLLANISLNRTDQTIALGATLLSLLEYINYYHHQLQHFDHAPDLRRLLTGRGFRQSKMSADLVRQRRRIPNGQ